MRLGIYAVLDKAVSAFAPPLAFRSKGEALRSFADACVTEGSQFQKHASDYGFYHLGEFDDSSGSMVNLADGPILLMNGFEAQKYLEGSRD